jgi:ubiquinone biosynthesis protein Coq4
MHTNEDHAAGRAHRHLRQPRTMLRPLMAAAGSGATTGALRDRRRPGAEAYALALPDILRDPACRRLVEERYRPRPASIASLLRLPAASLGHGCARALLAHGGDRSAFGAEGSAPSRESALDYVLARLQQTHAMWHVVTGFACDRQGEIALFAFELAQMRRPMAMVLAADGVLRGLLEDRDQVGDALAAAATGYRAGLAAEPFLAQRWEEGLELPVEEWRRRMRCGGVEGEARGVARNAG